MVSGKWLVTMGISGQRLVVSALLTYHLSLITAFSPLQAQQTVVPAPTLPQALVDVSTLPKVTGTTRTATSCSNIQTQLNAAVGGDEVVIPASFNCAGANAVNLSLPNHSGNGYVWVHTDQVSLALGTTINAGATGTYSLDYGPTTAYGTTITQICTINTICSVLATNVAAGAYHFCMRAPGVASCPSGADQATVLQ